MKTRVRLGYALIATQLLMQAGCGDHSDEGGLDPSKNGDGAVQTPVIGSVGDAGSVAMDGAAPAPNYADAAVVAEADAGSAEVDASQVGAQGFLLVAELAAGQESIHAYSLPELEHTGQIDDVELGSHLGAIALVDGRVITADNKHNQIIAIAFDAAGKPSIVNRVDAELGGEAVWGCGDKDLRYLAVASGLEGAKQVANIVRLQDFQLTKFGVTVNQVDGAGEELHPAIAGEPLHLFAGVGSEIRAWPLADVLAGTANAPVASIPINPGAHGPVVSHKTGAFYITTAAGTGFDGSTVDMPFARTKLIPWDVDGLSTGRNARPRLSADGRYIYGAIARSEPTGAERWAERPADLHVSDLETETARRLPLTTGIVSKFQLSRKYAFFANVNESGSSGILVDVQAGSSTFQQVVGTVPLAPLGNGPVVGQSTTGKEALGSAITPDGKWAFVSHGGDSKVSVIDTASKTVVKVLQTKTSLTGGGYLLAVQPGTPPTDTCTR